MPMEKCPKCGSTEIESGQVRGLTFMAPMKNLGKRALLYYKPEEPQPPEQKLFESPGNAKYVVAFTCKACKYLEFYVGEEWKGYEFV